MRKSHGWKLSDLARHTGIAASTLSKVENARLTLNYDRLGMVALAFGMSISEFLADEDDSPGTEYSSVASGRLSVVRGDKGLKVHTDSFDYSYLCTGLRHRSMNPMVVEVKAASLEEFGPLSRHQGEEFVIVLSGAVNLHSEFYREERLLTGDSAYFDAAMGHAYTRLGEYNATILSVTTGSGAPVI